jgi:hypothetical protein
MAAAGSGITLMTVLFPELATRDINKAGVKEFLCLWEEYLRRIASVTGAVARPLADALSRDIVQYWIDRKVIVDQTDAAILEHLKSIAKATDSVSIRRTIPEVFNGKVIGLLYKAEYEPYARVLELFSQVRKLIRENELETVSGHPPCF